MKERLTNIRIFPRKVLDSCFGCPEFSEESESCRPDWFKCNHPDSKYSHIMDENRWSGPLNKDPLNKKYDKVPIPDWCPLPKKRNTKVKEQTK